MRTETVNAKNNAGYPTLLLALPTPQGKRSGNKRKKPDDEHTTKDTNGKSNDKEELKRRRGALPFLLLRPEQPLTWPTRSPVGFQLQPGRQPSANHEDKGKQVVDGWNNGRKNLTFGNNQIVDPNYGINILESSDCSLRNVDLRDVFPSKAMKTADQRKNVKGKGIVHPSTILWPRRMNSSSGLSMGGAGSSGQSSTLIQGMKPPPPRDDQEVQVYSSSGLSMGGAASSGKSSTLMQGMKPPPPHDDQEVQVWKPSQPPLKGGPLQFPVPDAPNLELQKSAEAMFGKEAFQFEVPPVLGLHTALVVAALNPSFHDSLTALLLGNQLQQSPSPLTATTTAVAPSQQIPPPPPGFIVPGDGATGQQRFGLSSASGINSPTPRQNVMFQNSWAPTNGTVPPPPPGFIVPGNGATEQQQFGLSSASGIYSPTPRQNIMFQNSWAPTNGTVPPPPPGFIVPGDGATEQQQFGLSSASGINSPTPRQNVMFQNSWAPTNANMFLQPTYGTVQQQPVEMVRTQQHQVRPQLAVNPYPVDRDLFQQESNIFMRMSTQTVFGVPNFPLQNPQGYAGSSSGGTFGFGNSRYQGYPPPGF